MEQPYNPTASIIQEAMSKLSRIDHMSLNDFADFLELQADLIRQVALQNTQSREDQSAAAMDFLRQIPRIVSRYLVADYTVKEAIKKTAETTGAPIEAVESAWKRFADDNTEKSLRQRNRLLVELANMGLTNAEIGKRVGLHPNSVSRLVSKARRMNYLSATDNKQSISDLRAKGDDNVF